MPTRTLTAVLTGAAMSLALSSMAYAETDVKALPAPVPVSAPAPAAAAPAPVADASASSTSGPLNATLPTPKIVQDAVQGLQKTDPINLDDMVRAQDAINRLDLLLEIEKRQTELKKLRDERNKNSMMASGIPSSALNLPPIRTASMGAMPMKAPEPPKPSSSYTLKRIMGAEGRYSAVLADGGMVVSARPGESLPDGSKVKSVSLTSVSLVKDGKSKTLTIPSDSYIVRGEDATD